MKKIIKTLTLISFFTINYSCGQTTMRTLTDAKKMEINKKEFIGKPLSYLLSKMNVEVKSILAFPNKNPSEINRITFRFVTDYEYQKTLSKEVSDRPTHITAVFNQNWGFEGKVCRATNPSCTQWTKTDEENLKNLIVYDVYVLGKD